MHIKHLLVMAWLFVGCALAQAQVSSAGDLRWLDRITYGANPDSAARLARVGREKFLAEQLTGLAPALPPDVEARIAALSTLQQPLRETLLEQRKIQKAVKKNKVATKSLRKGMDRERAQTLREVRERVLLRAVYSRNQLHEQMAWFWFNHFNVFHKKGQVDTLLADYEDSLRPHLTGNFRALVKASLMHPAMLQYLDNTRSRSEKINENYARELLELHTLGVDGGYTQTDVQELARVLTGLRVAPFGPAGIAQAEREGVVLMGLAAFDPQQHDAGDKRVLGHTIKGSGVGEIDEVLDILVRHPATAQHLATRLATYFVADAPSPALVDRLAKRFADSGGEIRPVLEELFASPEFAASLGTKLKSSWQYVVSSLRLLPGEVSAAQMDAALQALEQLAQSPYAQTTPDGFSLSGKAWLSPGQLETRLAVAARLSVLAEKNGGLADAKLETLLPIYSAARRALIDAGSSPRQRMQLMLSAPEFMYR